MWSVSLAILLLAFFFFSFKLLNKVWHQACDPELEKLEQKTAVTSKTTEVT